MTLLGGLDQRCGGRRYRSRSHRDQTKTDRWTKHAVARWLESPDRPRLRLATSVRIHRLGAGGPVHSPHFASTCRASTSAFRSDHFLTLIACLSVVVVCPLHGQGHIGAPRLRIISRLKVRDAHGTGCFSVLFPLRLGVVDVFVGCVDFGDQFPCESRRPVVQCLPVLNQRCARRWWLQSGEAITGLGELVARLAFCLGESFKGLARRLFCLLRLGLGALGLSTSRS